MWRVCQWIGAGRWAALWLTVLTVARAGELVPAILRPEELRPGMRGYGLSVFRGTAPERFEVEILGVLPNAFPKQDLILIRMSGADLEKHKVIAGMSGSPIYIEDKLVGALGYGWAFENEPMAGVTPIHNMLADLQRPPPPPGLAPRAALWPSRLPDSQVGTVPGVVSRRSALESPRPLLTPLACAGFHPQTVQPWSDWLEQLGFWPVTAGGVGGNVNADANKPARLVPGGAVGVQLVRGDLNATAIGTVTHVEGERVLAFGHPFLQMGQLVAPAVHAEVHAIMSSVARSFKLASAREPVGAMVGDWLSCIVVDTAVTAPVVPVALRAVNQTTGLEETYRLEVVQHPLLTPSLLQMAMTEVVRAASPTTGDAMVRVQMTVQTKQRPVELENTFHQWPVGMAGQLWQRLVALFQSPFGDPELRAVTATVEIRHERRTAEIKGAYFRRAEVERGGVAELVVMLLPFGGSEMTVAVPIEVPAYESQRTLVVSVLPGGQAPADVAPPETLRDYLTALEKQHRNTDLVVLVRRTGQGLRYRGRLLKSLPPSAWMLLDDASTTGISGATDVEQIVVPTDWVLTGRAVARVPIRSM